MRSLSISSKLSSLAVVAVFSVEVKKFRYNGEALRRIEISRRDDPFEDLLHPLLDVLLLNNIHVAEVAFVGLLAESAVLVAEGLMRDVYPNNDKVQVRQVFVHVVVQEDVGSVPG